MLVWAYIGLMLSACAGASDDREKQGWKYQDSNFEMIVNLQTPTGRLSLVTSIAARWGTSPQYGLGCGTTGSLCVSAGSYHSKSQAAFAVLPDGGVLVVTLAAPSGDWIRNNARKIEQAIAQKRGDGAGLVNLYAAKGDCRVDCTIADGIELPVFLYCKSIVALDQCAPIDIDAIPRRLGAGYKLISLQLGSDGRLGADVTAVLPWVEQLPRFPDPGSYEAPVHDSAAMLRFKEAFAQDTLSSAGNCWMKGKEIVCEWDGKKVKMTGCTVESDGSTVCSPK